MPNYTIFPLHVGDLTRQKSNLAYMQEPGVKIDFPLICWYLTDGVRKLMVDTGGTPPDHRWQPHTRTPEQDPARALECLRVHPEEITDVIMTHLHWDHAGNNHLFPNAKFYVQRAELEEVENPPVKMFAGSYDKDVVARTKYIALEGDCELWEGIRVITTPGHSMGSQSVIVDTAGGPHVIVGDLVGLFECYEHDPMFVNGIHIDLRDYYRSLERVKAIGGTVLPGHDYKVFQHTSYPVLDEKAE